MPFAGSLEVFENYILPWDHVRGFSHGNLTLGIKPDITPCLIPSQQNIQMNAFFGANLMWGMNRFRLRLQSTTCFSPRRETLLSTISPSHTRLISGECVMSDSVDYLLDQSELAMTLAGLPSMRAAWKLAVRQCGVSKRLIQSFFAARRPGLTTRPSSPPAAPSNPQTG